MQWLSVVDSYFILCCCTRWPATACGFSPEGEMFPVSSWWGSEATCKVAADNQFAGLQQRVPRYYMIMPTPKRPSLHENWAVFMDIVLPSILCSNARAPVAQLVRESDRYSADPARFKCWLDLNVFFGMPSIVRGISLTNSQLPTVWYL